MPIPAITPCLVGCTTVTVGTGDYILTADALPAPFSHPFFVLSDGQQVFLTVTDQVSYEHGIYTYHSAGGPYGSFSRTTITSSSTAQNATRTTNPINWGAAGTRSLFSDVPETGFMLAGNNGSDIANTTSFRNNLGVDPKFLTTDKTVFIQAAAPTNWVQDTSLNDRVIRIVSGVGGATGGSWTITGLSTTVTVADHALIGAEIPAHSHDVYGFLSQVGSGTSWAGLTANPAANAFPTSSYGAGLAHGHPGSTAATTQDGSWRLPYVDTIICRHA